MLIHADFTRQVVVTPDQHRWVPSPMPGVARVMLDRIGDEKARATSLVRYAPDSHFPRHFHPGGEEILVLSGTFSDERGHCPQGWYLRNPPGSSHQPYSQSGATIFVKLWQMPPGERESVRIDTRHSDRWQILPDQAGESSEQSTKVCPLFSSAFEQVSLQRLPAGKTIQLPSADSAELLVLTGSVVVAGQTLPCGSWMRFPVGACPAMNAGMQGATVYLKTGHLAPATLQGAAA